MRPLHRRRGSHQYSTFRAVNATSGEARLLLTLRWKDDDPDATAITITEVIPDDGLADVVKQNLKALMT